MQVLPAGAPAHAGGAAVVSDVLIGTVLQAAALVVVAAGYPAGTPPSEGGGAPLDDADPEPEPPLLEPLPPVELADPPDADDDRDPDDDPDEERPPPEDELDGEPDDDVADEDDPEELLNPPPWSVQTPWTQRALLPLWQSASPEQSCC